MDRRSMLSLGSVVIPGAWPVGARSQQAPSGVLRIGIIAYGSTLQGREEAIFDDLRDLGYVEGRNLKTEIRWAHGSPEKLAEAAAEMVRLKVDVIVATATPVANAARKATSSIPIVLSGTAIAEGAGLVDTLARPGGNVTGLTIMSPELAGKKLQLLQQLVPGASRIGVFPYINMGTPASKQLLSQLGPVAQRLGIRLLVREINLAADLKEAFVSLKNEGAQALLVSLTPINSENRTSIVSLAAQHRLPTLYEGKLFPEVGGLMSYAPDLAIIYRRTAIYIDKIFRGANPADIPVEQPTRFELVVNRSAAKALGITFPREILALADVAID